MIEQEIDSLAPGRDFSRRDFVRTRSAPVLPPRCCRWARRPDQDRCRRPARRRGDDPGRQLQDAGLSRRAGGQDQRTGGAGGQRDLRRARAHRRRGAAFRQGGLLRDRAGAVRAPGRRRLLRRDLQAGHRSDRQGARRAGDGRPRCHRGMGQGAGCRHRQAGGHGLLLGRAHHLAVQRAQPRHQGRRGLVRAPGGGEQSAAADEPGRTGRQSSTAPCSACTAPPTPASRSTRSTR